MQAMNTVKKLLEKQIGINLFPVFVDFQECFQFPLIWCAKFSTSKQCFKGSLTLKVPNARIAEYANTVDPDEMAHNELAVSFGSSVCTLVFAFSTLPSLY